MERDDLLSALDFGSASLDTVESQARSAFQGGLVDLFTYQDITGRAQHVRSALSKKSSVKRGSFLGFLASTALGGVVGATAYGLYTSSRSGTSRGGESKFLESLEDLARGSATQADSLYVARVRATKQLELAELGSKRFMT